ncbi:ferritin-like domain-containing protein [Antrihabitans sp. YC2-6]|uniref:ferritin-like domain-containing protein n=1 Tax=Antrihabitans sp. YC2-6 TaxID=2799498 RepID=UPI0018F4AA7E|nr:ferritin-like domain-containing protein [Antrihabitans sp. YC2-6]MBJ8347204.1 ferritin-like domain-containing protein [Antrihabitans sp. YC2-6]
MALDLEETLAKVKERQWALADIDWDAPGAETISAEFKPKLKAFMADLAWIENVGARGFAALARKAPNDTLREIYTYFHAEEQRHANAELALMKRWGMLDDGEMPEPNVNIRMAMDWLDRFGDDMSMSALGTVIPMLEVALDGALLKFLLEEVHDPVCDQVFAKINNDESRHIAVGFEVLDMLGHGKLRKLLIEFVGTVASPSLIVGAAVYIPLLNRTRNEVVDMGFAAERLYFAMDRFKKLGDRSTFTPRMPLYQVVKWHASLVVNSKHPYHLLANTMVWASDRIPRRAFPAIPSWFNEITHEPVSVGTARQESAA